ncbi:hypothetical protein ACJ41O_015196 [Fusarium nematophilum]
MPDTGRNAGLFNAFIVSTSLDKPDPQIRRSIRSHVMRGRNTRADRRARAQAQAQAQAQREDAAAPVSSKASNEREHESLVCQRADGEWALPTPHKIASELSLARYPFEMKPYMLDLMYQAFTTVKPCTYAVDMKVVNDMESHTYSLADIHLYQATMHSILFTAQSFQDFLLGRPSSRIAQFHLGETLKYLQQSLNDESESIALATMGVVTTLASAASVLGDLETVGKHMDGLGRIVELRGGVGSIESGSLIEHKAQRLDIGLAMGTGRKPRLLPKEISWAPQIALVGFKARYKELEVILPAADPRLLAIWADLRHYSAVANHVGKTGAQIQPDLFLRLSTSVPNRLMNLEYDAESLSEVLRVSMLAYVKGILCQIPGIGRQMRHLYCRLELVLHGQQCSLKYEQARFIFWALFIAGLTIFEGFEEDWHHTAVAQVAETLGIQTWVEAKRVLMGVLWIEGIYDIPGKAAFERLFCVLKNG